MPRPGVGAVTATCGRRNIGRANFTFPTYAQHQRDCMRSMVSVDARTGAELWRRPSGAPCRNTTPAYSDELLYLGCTGDDLIVLNAATGQEVWRYSSPDASFVRGTPTGSSPAVADGVTYMGFSDGNVTALDARTGARLWTHRTGGGITSSPAISGNTLVIGAWDGNLYAFTSAAQ